MEIIEVTKLNIDKSIQQAAIVLKNKGIVVYPTETAYGFAANGLLPETIHKIFQLKKRSRQNPIHLIIPSIESARNFAYISREQHRVLKRWLPGPLTFVLPRKPIVPECLVNGATTIGIRIPQHPVTSLLSSYLDFPYTATSANFSGQPPIYSIDDLQKQFPAICDIDLVLDYGNLPQVMPSTVIDICRWPKYQILRPGAIAKREFAMWAATISL